MRLSKRVQDRRGPSGVRAAYLGSRYTGEGWGWHLCSLRRPAAVTSNSRTASSTASSTHSVVGQQLSCHSLLRDITPSTAPLQMHQATAASTARKTKPPQTGWKRRCDWPRAELHPRLGQWEAGLQSAGGRWPCSLYSAVGRRQAAASTTPAAEGQEQAFGLLAEIRAFLHHWTGGFWATLHVGIKWSERAVV